jgi:hydroxyacylglutathione hydrolase
MYHSTREKLMILPADVTVYPAHGPGSLCGKSMSPDLQSSIGKELRDNYALQLMDELAFVKTLMADQPFMPKYFGYDVELNKTGAPNFNESIETVSRPSQDIALEKGVLVIDTRLKEAHRSGHVKNAINLQDAEKFETWLGSVVGPDEPFYLRAATPDELETVINKTAKIGYEKNIKAAILIPADAKEQSPVLDYSDFKNHPGHYTIIDVRNWAEIKAGKLFKDALTIPLPELRERVSEIPADKPIVVHCAAGYRSAAAAGIIQAVVSAVPVYDLSEAINEWK